MAFGLDPARGRPTISQQRPAANSLRGPSAPGVGHTTAPAQPKFTAVRGDYGRAPGASDMDMTWPQQQHQSYQPRGKAAGLDARVSITAREASERPQVQVPVHRRGPDSANMRAMSPPMNQMAERPDLGTSLPPPARGVAAQSPQAVPRVPRTPSNQQATTTNAASTLERLLSGVEDMRNTMHRDMHDRNATSETITKNAVTALLGNLRVDKTEGSPSDNLSASAPASEFGSAFSTGIPTDLKSQSQVLSELASIISDERRLHEESLPAACGVLRAEAEKVLHEIETFGSLVHKRFQEETVPAACEVLKCEVQKAVAELKGVGKSSGQDNVAIRSEADKGVALLREVISNEMVALRNDGEQMKADARNAISDMIEQEHRLQQDMIRGELSKATSQLKEVVSDSARSLAEAVPKEREIIRSESEKAAAELRNFVDYEKRLRQEVLLKEVAQQAESESRLEQHWSSLIQEEVAHHITVALANFEGRLTTVETSATPAAPIQSLDSTTILSSNEASRLSALEAQVQSALSFGSRAGPLEARIASLEQVVQASTARVGPVEVRIASLEQLVQAAVASAARAAPLEDVRELRTELAKMRGPTEDVATLVADMAKLRPLIQEVADVQSEVTKLQDLLPDRIGEVRSQVAKLQDLPSQLQELRSLVQAERQERTLAIQEESSKTAEMENKLQVVLDGIDSTRNKFESSVVKLHGEMASLRASMEELRAEASARPSVQKPLLELRSEQQEQKARLVTVAQALTTIEENLTKDMKQAKSDLARVQENLQWVSTSVKEETDSRLSTVARLETSIDDALKETNRIRRRMESLHQLIMHGNKNLQSGGTDDSSGTI